MLRCCYDSDGSAHGDNAAASPQARGSSRIGAHMTRRSTGTRPPRNSTTCKTSASIATHERYRTAHRRRLATDYKERLDLSKQIHETRSQAKTHRLDLLMQRALERRAMRELRTARRPTVRTTPQSFEGSRYCEVWTMFWKNKNGQRTNAAGARGRSGSGPSQQRRAPRDGRDQGGGGRRPATSGAHTSWEMRRSGWPCDRGPQATGEAADEALVNSFTNYT